MALDARNARPDRKAVLRFFDGTVTELSVAPGQTVDAKDLLVIVERREG